MPTRATFGDGLLLARAAAIVAGRVMVDDSAELHGRLFDALERALTSMTAVQRIKPIPRWRLMNEAPRSARRNRRR